MLICELVRPGDLTDRDIASWTAMCERTEAFRSPLLSPEFTQAVAKVRDDVCVAVFRRAGKTIGFLPHHRRPNRFARPVGAPFADYSALITLPDPGLDGRAALHAAGIDSFQAIGLIDPYRVFGEPAGEEDTAHAIDMRDDDLPDTLSKKHRKNVNRHRRNMVEMHGETRFIVTDRDRSHYDRMIALKRAQIHENGLQDFLAPVWATALFDRLFNAPESGLHGSLLTMMIGDTPVMFHYGIRLRDRMHPWISSYDPAFGVFSPGQIFLTDCQPALKASGVSYYDLSTGQSHYKGSFSNTAQPVYHTRLYGASPVAQLSQGVARLSTGLSNRMGRPVAHIVRRLHRRFDQIACLELGLAGRTRGVVYAFATVKRRMGARDAG